MQGFARALRRSIYLLVALALIVSALWFVRDNYGWVFSKSVRGVVVRNERVTNPTALLGARTTPEMMHSYAILIRSEDGELITASSEDRQWAIVAPGYCLVAKLYPYPFWELDKGGTYGNARVERIFECPPDLKAVASPAGGVSPEGVQPAAREAGESTAPPSAEGARSQ